MDFFTKTTPDFLEWPGYRVNSNSPSKDTGPWVLEGASVSGEMEVLTEYIQCLWFTRVQGNTICGERWLNGPKGLHRQSCVKSSVASQTASCQALTLFGFLWVSFPPEFCLEPEDSNGALNSKPNSAPSNHFPLLCFSASLCFPQGQTRTS